MASNNLISELECRPRLDHMLICLTYPCRNTTKDGLYSNSTDKARATLRIGMACEIHAVFGTGASPQADHTKPNVN